MAACVVTHACGFGDEFDVEEAPAMHVGWVYAGDSQCLGTRIKADKVVTAAECAERGRTLQFQLLGGSRRIAVSNVGHGFRADDPYQGGWALLTLEEDLGEHVATDRAFEPLDAYSENQPLWMMNAGSDGSARVARCFVDDQDVDCTEPNPPRGAPIYQATGAELRVVGLRQDSAWEQFIGDPFTVDRPVAIAPFVGFSAMTLPIVVSDPDWRHLFTPEGHVWNLSFEPNRLAAWTDGAFTKDTIGARRPSEYRVFVADAEGGLWEMQLAGWERRASPSTIVDLAISMKGSDFVLWTLGSSGQLCHRSGLGGGDWTCGLVRAGSSRLSVANTFDGTLLVLVGPFGVELTNVDDSGAFGDWISLTSDAVVSAAVGTLSSGDSYVLVSRDDGVLHISTRPQGGLAWSAWREFPAGALPGVVQGFATGHLGERPEAVYALSDGVIYHTLERQSATSGADFEEWR